MRLSNFLVNVPDSSPPITLVFPDSLVSVLCLQGHHTHLSSCPKASWENELISLAIA